MKIEIEEPERELLEDALRSLQADTHRKGWRMSDTHWRRLEQIGTLQAKLRVLRCS